MPELPLYAFHATMSLLFCGCCATHNLECCRRLNLCSFSGRSDHPINEIAGVHWAAFAVREDERIRTCIKADLFPLLNFGAQTRWDRNWSFCALALELFLLDDSIPDRVGRPKQSPSQFFHLSANTSLVRSAPKRQTLTINQSLKRGSSSHNFRNSSFSMYG